MSDLLFKCTICGKQFPPTPDAMVELDWDPQLVPIGEMPDALTAADLRAMDTQELAEQGLTPEHREKLLRGEKIRSAACICLECQDEAHEEQCDREGEEWKGDDGEPTGGNDE